MGVSDGGPSSMEFAVWFPEKTAGLIAFFEAFSYSKDLTGTDAQIIDVSDFGL